ncbi:MAG: hypothetical protein M3R36_18185 [Bacteroidota bacterium]|nr:hypothetical protein [Bacteroidota bacterium]
MEAIAFIDLTDKQFFLYMNLITKIRTKYEENTFVLDYDWNEYRDYFYTKISGLKEFKKKRLKILEDGIVRALNEFIIFDGEKPVAFVAFKKLNGDRHEFIFDSVYAETPKEVLRVIFKVINLLLKENELSKAYYLSNKKPERELFKKSGIEITQEIVNSRLLKKDIDFEKLKSFVDNNKYAKDYNLILYREIPEEIFDSYVVFMNDVLNAKEFSNPVKQKLRVYTKDNLLRSIKIDKEEGYLMYMYMLFDKENIAGVCKVYIEKEDESVFVQQCGGITGVADKYRGKGLAKYLKALMYLKMSEDYPDFRHVLTDTFPWNKHMFSINEEFGFRIFNEGCIFMFTKNDLENF